MVGEVEGEFENPPNKNRIRETILVVGFIFVIGAVVSVWTGIWAPMVICIALGVLPLLTIYWQEYMKKPNLVRIVGGGLELEFQRKGTIFIDWNDILALRSQKTTLL